ncbi:hypothetical protein ACFQBQ_15295 [Granulicella cerasi]|uniref:Outer membrane protein beta-barrel domain-containing protein n=1 Tax=Granulicella cerasi TaxID=741063 RepID=A0ABW1ZDH6_9BACT|nr:hypothetical protein [Granulicella cerasi]
MPKYLLLSLALLGGTMPLHAQRTDVSVGGGFNNLSQGSAHGALVASGAIHFGDHLSVGAEYAYQSAGEAQNTEVLSGSSVISVDSKERLQNYGGVVRFGLLHHRPAQSYLLVAGGGLHVSDTVAAQYYYAGSTILSGANTTTANGGYFGAGAGANLPIRGGFGLRPEARYERQMLPGYDAGGYHFAASHANQLLVTLSLYKSFGGRQRN